MANGFMGDIVYGMNTTLPLFICCLIGYLMKRYHVVSDAFAADCANVVFYVAIPCSIFSSIAKSDFRGLFEWKLVAFLAISFTVLAATSLFICRHVIKNYRRAVTVAHNIFRGNFTLLGIPLSVSLLGKSGAASMVMMIPFGIMLSNLYSVAMLSSISADGNSRSKVELLGTVWEILKNPMTIASILGIVVAWAELPVPEICMNTIDMFSGMSSGLALFMLGTQLEVGSLCKDLHVTLVTVLARLLVIPAVFVSIAVGIGISGNALAAIFIFFASPTAVSCYVMAEKMGGDSKITGDAVLATTCFSSITLLLGIALLRTLQLI